MDDLIRRQDAIDLIENESRKWGDEYGVSDVLCDLADLPSAQPEIVRCKDCKHWKQTDEIPVHYGECLDSVVGYWYCAPREDFFCKNGERRSE